MYLILFCIYDIYDDRFDNGLHELPSFNFSNGKPKMHDVAGRP